MSIKLVNKFRTIYQRFLKWLPYMAEKRNKMDPKLSAWKDMLKDFNKKIVEPMDKLWLKLTDGERRLF